MSQRAYLLPAAAALAGVACLSLMDAFMKGAALAIGAFSAAWLRSVLGTAIAAPLWLARGGTWPKPDVMRIHLLRGVVSAFMALSFFYALTKLPIAEAIAISFIAPLIALYLARLWLKEIIRPAAIFASLLGFAGTLVIVGGKIEQDTLTKDVALGLAAILFSALLYAVNFIIIRKQSQMAGPAEIATFHSGVSAAILGLAVPFIFTSPDTGVIVEIAAASALTVAGAMAIAWAYARAETQALVPLEYSGFLWAALFGWMLFGEQVTASTFAGTVIIVIACLIAARRPNRPAQSAL